MHNLQRKSQCGHRKCKAQPKVEPIYFCLGHTGAILSLGTTRWKERCDDGGQEKILEGWELHITHMESCPVSLPKPVTTIKIEQAKCDRRMLCDVKLSLEEQAELNHMKVGF